MDKPILSNRAFKNVDMDTIDYQKDAAYVIENIIEQGTSEDFLAMRRFYGKKKIRKEVVNAKWTGGSEISFCCLLFNLKPKDFKNYKERKPNPKLSSPKFKNSKPDLSKQAFVGVDMDKINYQKQAVYVVTQVLEEGNSEDFDSLLKFYGHDLVGELALEACWLSDPNINFCCEMFNVKPTDFNCWKKKEANRAHWDF